jgi:hypothetical protein
MKLVKESLYKGVADVYAERLFHIPQEDSIEDKKIKAVKKINTIAPEEYSGSNKGEIVHKFNERVYIVKNPKTLKGIQDVAKGVINKNGDLYLITFNLFTHSEIIEALAKKGELKYDENWHHKIPKNFVTIQRVPNKNEFVIGESQEIIDPDYNNGEYKKKWNMPDIKIAAKYFVPFFNAAKRKNPQYKFHTKNSSQFLGESFDKRKELEQKTQYINDNKNLGLKKKIINIFNDARKKPVKICLVNGSYVKATDPGLGFKEFVEGGHHYVDSYPGYKKFIPEDEIWVDDAFKSKPEEIQAIIQHEFIERNLMKYKKWSYSKAHEYSNKKEAELRKK